MKTRSLVLIGVLVIALAAMAMPVMAADPLEITGNPTAVNTVTLSGYSFSMTLDPSQAQPIQDTSLTMTGSSNDPDGYTISVVDAQDHSKTSSHAGCMQQYTTAGATYGSYNLSYNMTVAVADDTSAIESLAMLSGGSNSKTLQVTSAPGQIAAKQLTFSQRVTYTDPMLPVGDVYRMVVQFNIVAN